MPSNGFKRSSVRRRIRNAPGLELFVRNNRLKIASNMSRLIFVIGSSHTVNVICANPYLSLIKTGLMALLTVWFNHYLSFPISVGLRTGNKVALFGQFGTVFSRILSSRIVYPPGGLIGQEGLIIDRINLHSVFDLTVMLRVGVIAEVTNRFETFVSGTLEHGIFGLNTAVGQHMGFLGHVGIKYRVGKAME